MSTRATVIAVALIAFAHGLLWTVLIPPFQVPDETDHVAYVQYIAETGKLPPDLDRPPYSTEERTVFYATGALGIIGRGEARPPATKAIAEGSDDVVRQSETWPRDDGGGPSTASAQPPLSYALAAIPYWLGSGGSLLTREWLIRLLSVVWFAATAAGVALFARELLPSWRFAPLVAGLVVALQPALAFASAGVNPDALLFAVSTFALLAAVRVVRHGLTLRRAVVLGLLTGVGIVTKVTFAGLIPGLAVALALALRRSTRDRVRLAAAAIGSAAVLPLIYVIWATVVHRGLLPPSGGTQVLPVDQQPQASLTALLSYAWQLYLPRPPFLSDQFGYFAPYATWVKGFLGRLGWLDYGLSDWMYRLGAVVLAAMFVLAVVALRRDGRWRRRGRELVVLAVCTLGLFAMLAYAGYDYRRQTGFGFEQGRYLFPLIALYAVAVVAATTAFGRRLAPALAAVFVGAASLHVLAAVFATVARYYG